MKTNRKVFTMIQIAFAVIIMEIILLPSVISVADSGAVAQQALVDKARITVDTFMADPEMEWLQANLKNARGLVIVPELLKAGFVLGGSGGSGVLLVRDEKTGVWSEPAFYTIGSASIGLQIGAQKSELIMAVMTQKGVDSLYTTSFKLGGEVSIAVGPVGSGAAAKGVRADFISFMLSKGAFAGVSLEGAVIKTRNKANAAYYGREVTPVDILVKRSVANPKSAELRKSITRAAEAK